MGIEGTVAITFAVVLGLVVAQSPSSTEDLISYFPVGTVALPGITESPSSYVGPTPTQTHRPQPAEPTANKAAALRNIVELRCTSFNEFRAVEYFMYVSKVVSRWITFSTSNASNALRNSLMVAFNSTSSTLFANAYSTDSIFARLVPSRTLLQGSSPIPLSHRQLPSMIAVEYGEILIVSLMLRPLNRTTKFPVLPHSGDGRYEYPVGLSTTSPTSETSVLCEIFSTAFQEDVFSDSRETLTSASSDEDFIRSAFVDVRCPQFIPRIPAVANVGVNWLWVAFIALGGVCISLTVYTMFLRTQSDADVDINAADANASSGGGEVKPGMPEADDLGSRVDEKTESGFAMDTERLQLVERRKKRRLNELISKALTGDSTIYGASEEEREMVALVLKNPKFDGGRLAHDGEASPVEVVLTHDRLFRLPPADFNASTGVVGRKGAGGRVTTVTFPAAVHNRGAAMVDGSGGSLSVSEILTSASLTSNMEQLQQEDSPESSGSAPAPEVEVTRQPESRHAVEKDAAANDTEDETARLNRMITEATLRNLQRREGQLSAPSSTIKDRLKKILESDDYDNV